MTTIIKFYNIFDRALCLLLLPQTAEQGHLQGAGWQAILPRVLRSALWINFCSTWSTVATFILDISSLLWNKSKKTEESKQNGGSVPSRVTRLGDFSPSRLLFVDTLKKKFKNGNTLSYKFNTFSLLSCLKMVSNLAWFCLATYLDTFQKIGWFFPNHLVTLIPIDQGPML